MAEHFFEFDDIGSQNFDLQIVRLDGNMFPISYVSSKDIIEEETSRMNSPYFYRTKYKPLSFSLSFTTKDGNIDTNKLYKIADWLFPNTYRKFISSDNTSRILYCMGINQIDFITNGMSQGYFTVEFRCRDPFYLTLPSVEIFDLSENVAETTIQIVNLSNVQDYYFPEVEVELLDDETGIEIYNMNDGNRVFGFNNLNLLETIYINNNKKIIISSTGNYRFDKMLGSKNWLRLVKGVNNLRVIGKCNLKFRNQFPVWN